MSLNIFVSCYKNILQNYDFLLIYANLCGILRDFFISINQYSFIELVYDALFLPISFQRAVHSVLAP